MLAIFFGFTSVTLFIILLAMRGNLQHQKRIANIWQESSQTAHNRITQYQNDVHALKRERDDLRYQNTRNSLEQSWPTRRFCEFETYLKRLEIDIEVPQIQNPVCRVVPKIMPKPQMSVAEIMAAARAADGPRIEAIQAAPARRNASVADILAAAREANRPQHEDPLFRAGLDMLPQYVVEAVQKNEAAMDVAARERNARNIF